MKKIKFVALLLAVLLGGFVFFNSKTNSQDESHLYLFGTDKYERNGIISIASTDEPAINVSNYKVSGDITLDVYQASMDDVLNFLVHDEENKQINKDISLDRMTKVATIEHLTGGKIELPIGETGVWLLNAHAGVTSVRSFLVRSSYGAVVKNGDDKFVFWVQDFKTRRSAADTRVEVYSLNEKVHDEYEVRTSHEGVVEGGISAKYDVAVVGHANDKAIIPLNLRYMNYGGRWERFQEKVANAEFFTFTDRPLYKPGDKIYFKTVLREDDNIQYSVPSGKITVELAKGFTEYSEKVFTGEYEISSFGTISGEIAVPENIKTGEYYLITRKAGEEVSVWDSSYINVAIEYYQKPEFGLNMTLNSDEFVSGEEIGVDFQGDYFSGQPLKEYNVTYTVSESSFYDPSYYGYDYDLDRYLYGYRYGTKVSSGNATLDENGHASVVIPTEFVGDRSKVYTIEAVIQGLGNEVVEVKNVLIHSGQYGIYRKDRNYGGRVGSETEMSFVMTPFDDSVSLGNREITIVPRRNWWEKSDDLNLRYSWKRQEELLESSIVRSNDSGEFIFKFKPEKEGSYSFTISGKDDRGNIIANDFSVWISNESGYYFSGEANNDISVSLNKESYKPGETASITVSSVHENRDVFLTFERGEVHRHRVVSLDGNNATIQETLVDTDAPGMIVEVVSFSDFRLDRANAKLKVSAEGKKLFIEMNTDKERYSPGDTAEVEITVKDKDGNPEEGDLAVWAVDKAIFELASSDRQDIFTRFWGPRYSIATLAHSLEAIGVSMAERGGCFVAGTKVLMSNGSEKNIEDVSAGEYVLTRTEDSNELITARVSKTHSIEVLGYLNINHDKLHITDNHILWVNGAWKEAGDIQIGDRVIDEYGNEIEITSLSWQKEKVQVYNFEIEKEHSYFANGIWVHNGKGDARSVFSDTAYWNPKVRTDKNGKTKISFVVPDNLTTWVISAVGVTKDSNVGEMSTEIVTSKKIIIRPQLPNILYKGDSLTLRALAQNFSGEDRTFKIGMRFDSGQVGNEEQNVLIPAMESKFVEWSVDVEKEDQNGQFEFYMKDTDSDDEDLSDEVILNVPIKQFGYQEVSAWVGDKAPKFDFKLADDSDLRKTNIDLSLSTTLLGSLSPAMKYLAQYPYGCVEQTTSRFVPAIMIKENPSKFKDILEDKNIDEFLKAGSEKLAKMQNSDGGWSWSSWDSSDVFVTAYVSEYLLRAKSLGANVEQETLNRAKGYLERFDIAKAESIENREDVVALYGRSLFGSDKDKREITRFSEKMSSDLVSLAIMTNIRNGYTNSGTNGVNHLKSVAKTQGEGVYWDEGSLKRFGTSHTSTAFAIRALIMAGDRSDTVVKAVRYLSDTRQGRYWSNTFATAQVMQAFVDFSRTEDESRGDSDYRVFLNGNEIAKGTLKEGSDFEKINVPVSDELKDDSSLSIEVNGNNFLYTSLVLDEFRTSKDTSPVTKGIKIERTYSNAKGLEYNIVPGDIVNVELKVIGVKDDQRYLVIEDQLPSGLVPINERFENVSKSEKVDNYYQGGREYTQNGVIIMKDNARSSYHTYKARAVSVGDFSAPPATASLMYKPDVYAHSGVSQVRIDRDVIVTEKKKEKEELEVVKKGKSEIAVIVLVLGIISFLGFAYWKGYLKKDKDEE